MTPEQARALANPLNTATGSVEHLRTIRRHKRGFLIVTVLAVDR
jgi:hypothetical protein